MSRVVKGVGRVLTKVMKAHAKVIEKVIPGGKKIVAGLRKFHHKYGKKILKVVAIAAAVYFTGGAALGALSAASAGTSIAAGTMSGLSASWAGVAGAMTGGGLSSLGAGWAGAASGLSTVAGGGAGFGTALSTAGSNLGSVLGVGGAPASTTGVLAPTTGAANTAIGQGIGSQIAPSVVSGATTLPAAGATTAGGFFSNPLVQQAGVQAVSGMAKGAMQAKAANDTDKRQAQMDEEARARYNRNMGSNLLETFNQFKRPGA